MDYRMILSARKHDQLLKNCEQLEFTTVANETRKSIQFGLSEYDYKQKTVIACTRPFPPWLKRLADSLGCFDQCIVNRYEINEGISAHIDHPSFGPIIACVSLGASATIVFQHKEETLPLQVEPGSVYFLKDAFRSLFTHQMLPLTGNKQRYSITFRTSHPLLYTTRELFLHHFPVHACGIKCFNENQEATERFWERDVDSSLTCGWITNQLLRHKKTGKSLCCYPRLLWLLYSKKSRGLPSPLEAGIDKAAQAHVQRTLPRACETEAMKQSRILSRYARLARQVWGKSFCVESFPDNDDEDMSMLCLLLSRGSVQSRLIRVPRGLKNPPSCVLFTHYPPKSNEWRLSLVSFVLNRLRREMRSTKIRCFTQLISKWFQTYAYPPLAATFYDTVMHVGFYAEKEHRLRQIQWLLDDIQLELEQLALKSRMWLPLLTDSDICFSVCPDTCTSCLVTKHETQLVRIVHARIRPCLATLFDLQNIILEYTFL